MKIDNDLIEYPVCFNRFVLAMYKSYKRDFNAKMQLKSPSIRISHPFGTSSYKEQYDIQWIIARKKSCN